MTREDRCGYRVEAARAKEHAAPAAPQAADLSSTSSKRCAFSITQ